MKTKKLNDTRRALLLQLLEAVNSQGEFDLIQAELQSLSISRAAGKDARLMDVVTGVQLVECKKEVISTWKA